MTEADFTVKGWLLSTGTLRILALLALFRHPEPPPLIIIEEIENGLDPRSVHLIVEEIRRVTESGRSQVILTTHSPYLLDLLDLVAYCAGGASGRGAHIHSPRDDDAGSWTAGRNALDPASVYTEFGKAAQSRTGMKVGMIFECADEGPDFKVCEHLAKRIRPDPLWLCRTLVGQQNETCSSNVANPQQRSSKMDAMKALHQSGTCTPASLGNRMEDPCRQKGQGTDI